MTTKLRGLAESIAEGWIGDGAEAEEATGIGLADYIEVNVGEGYGLEHWKSWLDGCSEAHGLSLDSEEDRKKLAGLLAEHFVVT